MKRRRREFSIFTLSALDVLAMSAGVFVLIVLMLMPYYRKIHDAGAEIDAVRSAEMQTITEVRTLQDDARLYRGEARAAEAEAARLNAAAAALESAANEQKQIERSTGAANPEQGGNVETPVIEALDLVFVIDTTASMEPVIRDVASSLRSIVKILESLVPSVRVGVVAYKDRDSGLPPVTSYPLTDTDDEAALAGVIGFLQRLSASTVGSLTIAEDVHLGLRMAFSMPLRSNAKQALVVIGDARVHDHLRAQTLDRTRQFVRAEEHRNLSALFVTTPTSLRYGNRDRGFFIQLADAGGGEFHDHTGSMIESVLLSVLVD